MRWNWFWRALLIRTGHGTLGRIVHSHACSATRSTHPKQPWRHRRMRTCPRICCALNPQPASPNVPTYELSQDPFLPSHSSAFTRWNALAAVPCLPSLSSPLASLAPPSPPLLVPFWLGCAPEPSVLRFLAGGAASCAGQGVCR